MAHLEHFLSTKSICFFVCRLVQFLCSFFFVFLSFIVLQDLLFIFSQDLLSLYFMECFSPVKHSDSDPSIFFFTNFLHSTYAFFSSQSFVLLALRDLMSVYIHTFSN